MGYSAYITNCYLKPSRELTKEEIKYIDEELDFDVGDNNIYLEEEYYGLCPDGYLQEDINRIIEYGNERGFTLNGSIDVDMTMGCCGKARYKIDNQLIICLYFISINYYHIKALGEYGEVVNTPGCEPGIRQFDPDYSPQPRSIRIPPLRLSVIPNLRYTHGKCGSGYA